MNCIRIGFYYKKPTSIKTFFFRKKIYFLEVPVARSICISSYVFVVEDDEITSRLGYKFYKEVTPQRMYEIPSSGSQDKKIIHWALNTKSVQKHKEFLTHVVSCILNFNPLWPITLPEQENTYRNSGETGLPELSKVELKEFLAQKRGNS